MGQARSWRIVFIYSEAKVDIFVRREGVSATKLLTRETLIDGTFFLGQSGAGLNIR